MSCVFPHPLESCTHLANTLAEIHDKLFILMATFGTLRASMELPFLEGHLRAWGIKANRTRKVGKQHTHTHCLIYVCSHALCIINAAAMSNPLYTRDIFLESSCYFSGVAKMAGRRWEIRCVV